MNFLNLKKKKFIGGLFLALVIFTALAAPINHEGLINIANAQQTVNECGTVDFGCHLAVFFNKTLPGIITGIVLTITSWVLGVTGFLLNEVIQFTVVDMAANIRNVDGINIAWKVMRDLANLGFIFILLYVAIGTILQIGGVNTKKILVNVIIIALLLNFSLFFTKLMIDVSNIVTVGFYNKISNASGLSGAFMDRLGVTSFYDVGSTSELVKSAGHAGKILLLGLFGGILFLITAFVFLAAALMFIMRYVTFIFLMIFSPLAFAAMALPKDKYSSKWWDKLMKNLIFAPVFMIMIWTTLTILGDILAGGGPGTTNQMLGVINTPGSSMNMIINFIIVIVTMVATLIVANEIGAAGAKGAMKLGNKWRGKAQGLVGRGMLRATPLRTLDKRLSEGQFGQTAIGRGLRNATTGALMNTDFGSGKSISKIDKDLKTSREKYAKKQSENVAKAHEKQEDIRKDFSAIMLNSESNIDERYNIHEKMLESEKTRLAELNLARENAVRRKATYTEIQEIESLRAPLAQRVSEMETRHKEWSSKLERRNKGDVMTPAEFELSSDQVNEISRNTGKGDQSKLRLKMAQRVEAAKREEGGVVTRTGRMAGRVVGNVASGAVIGGAVGAAAGGVIGAPVGAIIGGAAGTKHGKKFLGKAKKYLYGEGQSARIETVKKLREDAKKGKKGGGDTIAKIKEALGEDDEGGGGGGEGGEKSGGSSGGESKS